MTVTERQYRQAEEDGAAARRAGKPRTAVPHYGWSRDAETLREAFERSWDREDRERKR